jgi:hypothetical protein
MTDAEVRSGDSAASLWSVEVDRGEHGWEVRILDAAGVTVSVRPCAGETEARTFASTVIQHLGWLSASKFRDYYRL